MPPIRPKLVILGSGYAAFSLLKSVDVRRYEVTLVSPRNHFLFTPLLPSAAVGGVGFRGLIETVRTARRGIRYHQAECLRIDTEGQRIDCEDVFGRASFVLDYDYLVVAVGAVGDSFGLPGVSEHALQLKDLTDARAIRNRVIACFERAARPGRPIEDFAWLLHFVVVGAGPVGVEFAARLDDFIKADMSRAFPDLVPYARVTLIDVRDDVTPGFDARLSEFAAKRFRREGIKLRGRCVVRAVREDAVVINDDEAVRFGLLVWTAGRAPTALVASLDLPKDERSRLVTDVQCRVSGLPGVFAIGDCGTIEGAELSATAQVAQQQGVYLARALDSLAGGGQVEPFVCKDLGMLGENPHKLNAGGLAAWLFWRSTYLTTLLGARNKILALSDWLRTRVFGRDISRF